VRSRRTLVVRKIVVVETVVRHEARTIRTDNGAPAAKVLVVEEVVLSIAAIVAGVMVEPCSN
jgi:hypothetical protein